MAMWLFKQEPETYSYDDLVQDGSTTWDGVSNPLARKHLRSVQVGDRVLFYHTGKEKAIVGEMKIISEPMADPNSEDEKAVVVQVQAVRKWAKAVPLSMIKEQEKLADWALVKQPRLSVMPVTKEQWQIVEALAKAQ